LPAHRRIDAEVFCNCGESKAHVAGAEVLAAESIKLLRGINRGLEE
jgi:hypothetical protein